ncbi:unnamed protein product [Penicillium pancosmium]
MAGTWRNKASKPINSGRSPENEKIIRSSGNESSSSDVDLSIATQPQRDTLDCLPDQVAHLPLYPQFRGPTHRFVYGSKCTEKVLANIQKY